MTVSLTLIPGIGSSTAKVLAENGFESVHQLASSTIIQLTKVPGFGTARADRVINAAIKLLTAADDSTAKAAQTTQSPQRTDQKLAPRPNESISDTKTDPDTKESQMKKAKKEQEKLKKAKKAAAKKAKEKKAKAKKAAAKKAAAKKVKAKKAAAKKAKAKKAAAKKAKEKKVKKAAAKKAEKKKKKGKK